MHEMALNNPVYIYEISYSTFRELTRILDATEGWRRLGK